MHHLIYSPHSLLATPSAMIPCLNNKVREINLMHYQGGTAQRALAKFLLSNAPVIDMLWCEFAEGPMWTQVQLMREIEGWLINKSAESPKPTSLELDRIHARQREPSSPSSCVWFVLS